MKRITSKKGHKYALDIDTFYVDGDLRYLIVAKMEGLTESLPGMAQGVVAYAEFSVEKKKTLIPEHTEVLEVYQRNGIATEMYNYVEESLRLKIRTSRLLSDDAEEFWKARKSRS